MAAPFTMETCTEDDAEFNALVNMVHMTELHINVKAKNRIRVASKVVYSLITLLTLSLSFLYLPLQKQNSVECTNGVALSFHRKTILQKQKKMQQISQK